MNPSVKRQTRPQAGFFEDDVAPLVERWRQFAVASTGEPAERFTRLANQLVAMVDSGQISFTTPVQAVSIEQRKLILQLPPTKTHYCVACRTRKSVQNFAPSKRRDGVMTRCRDCAVRSG